MSAAIDALVEANADLRKKLDDLVFHLSKANQEIAYWRREKDKEGKRVALLIKEKRAIQVKLDAFEDAQDEEMKGLG